MSDNTASTTPIPKVYIILDTNILQYLNNTDISKELIAYFSEIIKAGYTNFAMSDFSFFEAISGAPKKDEEKLIELLSQIPRFEVKPETCVAAGQMATLYRIEKAEFQNIESGDKIIAATAILSGSLILTANCNDFPRPFFREFHKRFVYYKRKNKDQMISIYLLQPDLEQINFRFNNRK